MFTYTLYKLTIFFFNNKIKKENSSIAATTNPFEIFNLQVVPCKMSMYLVSYVFQDFLKCMSFKNDPEYNSMNAKIFVENRTTELKSIDQ